MHDENIFKMSKLANTEIKDTGMANILICYLLHKINRPVEFEQLYEITVGNEIISYFFYQESIDYMLRNNMIKIVKNDNLKDCYINDEKGTLCATELKRYVPKSYRDKIILSALKYFARLKKEQEIIIEYIKIKTGGYYTHIRCLDILNDLMDIKLYAPDYSQAKLIGEKIMLNPAGFYGKVIALALSNKEEEYDLSDI